MNFLIEVISKTTKIKFKFQNHTHFESSHLAEMVWNVHLITNFLSNLSMDAYLSVLRTRCATLVYIKEELEHFSRTKHV